MNLGISEGFGGISPDLTFPATMCVDWIRVYQDPDAKNIGCDPPDFPTKAYIDECVTFIMACVLQGSPLTLIWPQVHGGVHEPEPDDVGGRFPPGVAAE